MATTKDYLTFVLEQLSLTEGLSHRAMMGEYLIYVQGKVAGGIYDNRLLIKPTPAARAMMPGAQEELPYPGAKPMLMVDNLDNREFLAALFTAVAAELPAPRKQ